MASPTAQAVAELLAEFPANQNAIYDDAATPTTKASSVQSLIDALAPSGTSELQVPTLAGYLGISL